MEIFLNIYIILNIFIIGTLFGSFFSLATYRIPRKEDIVSTRSYCPNCKHKLNFFDLIPVLSYLFSQGKCRYCKKHISIRYILLEITNGLVFVAFYLVFGFTLNMLYCCIVYVTIFLLTGTYIMKRKMVQNNTCMNGDKTSKKGVFLTELLIAMIIFTLVMASSFVTSRNANIKIKDLLTRNEAKNVAIKNMEIALATKYDTLYSFSTTETVDNIVYNVTVDVFSYADQYIEKQDIIKTVEVKVEYYIDGAKKDFSISSLKVRKV